MLISRLPVRLVALYVHKNVLKLSHTGIMCYFLYWLVQVRRYTKELNQLSPSPQFTVPFHARFSSTHPVALPCQSFDRSSRMACDAYMGGGQSPNITGTVQPACADIRQQLLLGLQLPGMGHAMH